MKNGDLRIWWISPIGTNDRPFYASVGSITEARAVLKVIASYDNWRVENKTAEDFSSAGGLEIFRSAETDLDYDGWDEWESEDGEDIWEVELNRGE